MSIYAKLMVCLAALAIGGCSLPGVRLNSEYNPSTYDYLNFALYHADRDTRVVVHGNPFGMAAADFAKAVTDNMQGANFGRRSNFTTTPGKSAEKNLRVVMAFNADTDSYGLCETDTVKARPTGPTLRLTAAWCFGDRQDSLVEAEVDVSKGVDDPRFRELVQETVLNLFPTHMDYILIRDDGGGGQRSN